VVAAAAAVKIFALKPEPLDLSVCSAEGCDRPARAIAECPDPYCRHLVACCMVAHYAGVIIPKPKPN
jgi:hypothetical protein